MEHKDRPWSEKSKKFKDKYFDAAAALYGSKKAKAVVQEVVEAEPHPVAKTVPELPTERQEQIKFVVWLKKQGYRVSASANGGSRHYLEAVNLKAMGVSPGFPDIEVPLPSGSYHGFYIEMKRKKGGKISPEQREWINYLKGKGYYAEVANGFEEAKEMFNFYISCTPTAA